MHETKYTKQAKQVVAYLIETEFIKPAGEKVTTYFGTVAHKDAWKQVISEALLGIDAKKISEDLKKLQSKRIEESSKHL